MAASPPLRLLRARSDEGRVMSLSGTIGRERLSLLAKIVQINWGLVLLVSALAGVGFTMLYSAAGGAIEPWAQRQMIRFGLGFVAMIAIALIDARFWLRWAYVFYGITVLLLVAVDLQGVVGMGAQRWLDLGPFQLQPSELMKIALVLALARYFHGQTMEDARRLVSLIVPLGLIVVPVALVVKQPDLGTAIMLIAGAAAILWLVGVRWWLFAGGIVAVVAAAPVAWTFLRDYQKARVLTFLDPSRDPLGAGYHITQSKIALGSGGIAGKGFLLGTQSHLNFLPEKQTDFIFTMFAEEFGLTGGIALMGLYAMILIYGYAIALRSTNQFGRLVALGVTTAMFLAMFINMAMVMGMIPAKGVPLPMVSYGGTSMIVTMCGFGFLINAWVHRDVRMGRNGVGED
jgi:rod shape determining protein RodA